MGHRFAEIAFTPSVRALQEEAGSRAAYARFDEGEDSHHLLSRREAEFIAARDSFYLASLTETGWPYVQHRGGPRGFMKVLNEHTLGFADFAGNRQFVTTGNVSHDDRVSLFFMDYANRRRLKMFGRAQIVGTEANEVLAQLEDDGYPARVQRGFLVHVEAFDWNCPQHITPRYTIEEMAHLKM